VPRTGLMGLWDRQWGTTLPREDMGMQGLRRDITAEGQLEPVITRGPVLAAQRRKIIMRTHSGGVPLQYGATNGHRPDTSRPLTEPLGRIGHQPGRAWATGDLTAVSPGPVTACMRATMETCTEGIPTAAGASITTMAGGIR
jgi:hypothetical protein